jgi:hypothetical protein
MVCFHPCGIKGLNICILNHLCTSPHSKVAKAEGKMEKKTGLWSRMRENRKWKRNKALDIAAVDHIPYTDVSLRESALSRPTRLLRILSISNRGIFYTSDTKLSIVPVLFEKPSAWLDRRCYSCDSPKHEQGFVRRFFPRANCKTLDE